MSTDAQPHSRPAQEDARRKLAVFMSNGRGLDSWQSLGSLSREVALYRHLQQAGWPITFYSYDRSRDLPRIDFPSKTVPQWPYLVPRALDSLYFAALPLLRYPAASERPTIILTNQAHSGWPAIGAARLWGAKLVARCDYLYGEREEVAGRSGFRVRRRIFEEKSVFRMADRCLVPTEELAQWVIRNYGIDESKILVVPNYVDTGLFRPLPVEPRVDIISVGRLVEKKRHQLLIQALEGTGVTLKIVGRGPWRDRLLRLANDCKVDLELVPAVPNDQLPQLFNEARMYVNVSRWEGHPKAMIEAMACGRPCLGADSPGISNLVDHGRTGWLVAPEPAEVRSAIEMLLGDDAKREELGVRAGAHALATFSLEEISRRYQSIFDELCADY